MGCRQRAYLWRPEMDLVGSILQYSARTAMLHHTLALNTLVAMYRVCS